MQAAKKGKASVLLVDDEPQVTTALADVLEDSYDVVTTTSPQAALDILHLDKRIAVIISDQRMPFMTGDQLFARAKEISPATRILITAYADISAVIDAVNDGKIFAYITKPWQPDDIILTVNRAAEYHELNRAILQERALLHQLMESSVDAIGIKDRAHRYIKLNQSEARILGTTDAAAAEGRTVKDFLPAGQVEARHRDEARLLDTGVAVCDRVEKVTTRDGQTRWYSSNMAPIRDLQGDIVGMVGITRDVTETKRLDEMKDQFIATVRHELRTPLTAIHGSLGLMRGSVRERSGDQAARLIDIGYANCEKLLSMINDLLDTLNLEKGEMQFNRAPLDIPELVEGAVAAGREQAAKKGVALSAEKYLPPILVNADRGRLRQALAKLVSNAIEATPSGRDVRMKARKTAGGYVRISVTDQGPGVPKEFSSRIFTRFAQADSSNARQKSGAGLGLYIAKSIVEAHDGRIGFVNRDGGGAEFFIELPIYRAPELAKAASARK